MNFIHQIERLQKLNKLIEQEKTGSPVELAKKLKIKERTLYELLDNIKSIGVNLKYNKKHKTYYYEDGHGLEVSFRLSVLKNEEMLKISGGCVLFYQTAFFPQCAGLASPSSSTMNGYG